LPVVIQRHPPTARSVRGPLTSERSVRAADDSCKIDLDVSIDREPGHRGCRPLRCGSYDWPAHLTGGADLVPGKKTTQRGWRALIKQTLHCGAPYAGSRLRWANSSTDMTCSRVTPGNHSRKSSVVAPPSRFSKRALTGTREFLTSRAPLTLPSIRSTAGHSDQSNMQIEWPALLLRARQAASRRQLSASGYQRARSANFCLLSELVTSGPK